MPDWVGADGMPTDRRYRLMAEREVRGVSPSYEAICLGVAGDADLLALLDSVPAPQRQPNLLLGAVRFLDGPVSSFAQFRAFVVARWPEVAAVLRSRRTQTNEAGRCATLLPVLAALPQPLALLEVGASAGLCLYPDRYGYDYVRDGVRIRVGDGAPRLACTVTGPAPLPDRLPDVVWRGGMDLNPLDVTKGDDLHWLESLVWPEQTQRFARLHEAVRAVRAEPPHIVRGDLTRDLAVLADAAPADATLVIFHSAVLAYVDEAGRAAFVEQVRGLAARRPVRWISNEAPGVVAGTEQPAGGPSRFVLAVDGVPLARTGPHGQSLDWLEAAPGRQGT